MNKPILILSAIACGIALAVAANFWRDLQHERNRADTLAERVALLEPVERSDASQTSNKPASERPVSRIEFVATAPQERLEQPKPALTGSREALQQVQRLQAALVDRTPLQDYQAHALVAEIDRFRRDTDDAASHGRLRQAVSDILFESQFETYVELFEREAMLSPPP